MRFDKAVDYFPPNNPTRWRQVVDALEDSDGKWGTWNHTYTRKRAAFRASRGTWHVERVGPFKHTDGDQWPTSVSTPSGTSGRPRPRTSAASSRAASWPS